MFKTTNSSGIANGVIAIIIALLILYINASDILAISSTNLSAESTGSLLFSIGAPIGLFIYSFKQFTKK